MLKSEKRKLWESLVRDYEKSSLTIREWCAKHGVTDRQLGYWRKQLRVCGEGTEWTPVRIAPDLPSASPSVGLARDGALPNEEGISDQSMDTPETGSIAICIGPAKIEVQAGFDQALLGEVLRVTASSLRPCSLGVAPSTSLGAGRDRSGSLTC